MLGTWLSLLHCPDLSTCKLIFNFLLTRVLIHIQDPSTATVRAEPSTTTDQQLLEYLNLVIDHGIARPTTLPLRHEAVGLFTQRVGVV
jgi:hypothetical protein